MRSAPKYVPEFYLLDFPICTRTGTTTADCIHIVSGHKFSITDFVCEKGVACMDVRDATYLISAIQQYCAQAETVCKIVAKNFLDKNSALILEN